MRDKFLVICLFFVANTLFGQSIRSVFQDVGAEIFPLKYEIDISKDGQLNHEISISLANDYFENSQTGLGFGARILFPKYYYKFNDHTISFFGINIYWNILRLFDTDNYFIRESIFGPYFSLDYLNWNLADKFSTMFNNYNFNIGIRFMILWILDDEPDFRLFSSVLNFETGYKITNGTNSIYFGIHVNLYSFVLWFLRR